MGTISCPEVREIEMTPLDRAKAHDAYIREFERQWNDWTEVAKVYLIVRRDREWELLGYHSFRDYSP